MKKADIIKSKHVDHIENEKKILERIEHPFIVSMDYVYQNDFRIYFLMKFIKGGELYRHLSK